jgi:hypothetical protein
MQGEPTQSPMRRRDRPQPRSFPLHIVILIAVVTAASAGIAVASFMHSGNEAHANPVPQTDASPSSTTEVTTTKADPYHDAIAQIADLRKRRDDLAVKAKEPLVEILINERFDEEGEKALYDGAIVRPRLQKCVLIAKPSEITTSSVGIKSYVGRVVGLGERPYVLTETVRGPLGATVNKSKKYVDTFEATHDDHEAELRRVASQLITAERQIVEQFPDSLEAMAIRQRMAFEAEETQREKAKIELAKKEAAEESVRLEKLQAEEKIAAEQKKAADAQRAEKERLDLEERKRANDIRRNELTTQADALSKIQGELLQSWGEARSKIHALDEQLRAMQPPDQGLDNIENNKRLTAYENKISAIRAERDELERKSKPIYDEAQKTTERINGIWSERDKLKP